MIRNSVVVVLLVLLVLGAGISSTNGTTLAQEDLPFKVYLPLMAQNTFEPVIAFASNRSGNFEIYLLNPRTLTVSNITQHPAQDMAPAIGPRGLLAWASDRTGNWEIFVGDIYGRNVRRLTNHSALDFHPTWSADGTRVAFASDRESPDGLPTYDMDIFSINVNRTGLIQMTDAPTQEHHPAWSYDSRKIAYTSDAGGARSIWVMNADGGNPTRMTEPTSSELFPAWSPDNQWVIYSKITPGGTQELEAIHTDRFTVQPATRPQNPNDPDFLKAEPSWSPDGKQVVFRMTVDGNTDLYMMDFDATSLGTTPRRLTTHPADDVQPAWSR